MAPLGRVKVFFIAYGLATYVCDIGGDIWFARENYMDGKLAFFALTIVFMLMPAVATAAFTMEWYVRSAQEKGKTVPKRQWVIRAITAPLTPFLRYIQALIYAWRYWRAHEKIATAEKRMKLAPEEQKQEISIELDRIECVKRESKEQLVHEMVKASYLRLFETFLENGPQLMLRIYVLMQKLNESPSSEIPEFKLVMICLSLVSMATAIATYESYIREKSPDKMELPFLGYAFLTVWKFLQITSRVTALVLLAFVSPVAFSICCLIRITFAWLWLLDFNTNFCGNQPQKEAAYKLILAEHFLFCYMEHKEEKPSSYKYRYFIYYAVTLLENSVIVVCWHSLVDSQVEWTFSPTAMHYLSFFGSIFAMITYHHCFHPNVKRSPLLPQHEAHVDSQSSHLLQDSGAEPDEEPETPQGTVATYENQGTAEPDEPEPMEVQAAVVKHEGDAGKHYHPLSVLNPRLILKLRRRPKVGTPEHVSKSGGDSIEESDNEGDGPMKASSFTSSRRFPLEKSGEIEIGQVEFNHETRVEGLDLRLRSVARVQTIGGSARRNADDDEMPRHCTLVWLNFHVTIEVYDDLNEQPARIPVLILGRGMQQVENEMKSDEFNWVFENAMAQYGYGTFVKDNTMEFNHEIQDQGVLLKLCTVLQIF